MKIYSVSEVADIVSVNEETVRRWIRNNKLDAERGLGIQDSKVSSDSLKNFLSQNRGLITSFAASKLDLDSSQALTNASLAGKAVTGALVGKFLSGTAGVDGAAVVTGTLCMRYCPETANISR